MEVLHHLVYIGEDLGEDDGVDKPDGAQGRERGYGKRRRLVGLGRLLVLESAVVVEMLIVVEEPAGNARMEALEARLAVLDDAIVNLRVRLIRICLMSMAHCFFPGQCTS